ncbi:hypothetical protein [Consotaella aegiceratis]|uniref:hypothetical protein n=1 Tax=Consotaella aegiceratis TaxID=3097961 RepID=UPI002F42E0B6
MRIAGNYSSGDKDDSLFAILDDLVDTRNVVRAIEMMAADLGDSCARSAFATVGYVVSISLDDIVERLERMDRKAGNGREH